MMIFCSWRMKKPQLQIRYFLGEDEWFFFPGALANIDSSKNSQVFFIHWAGSFPLLCGWWLLSLVKRSQEILSYKWATLSIMLVKFAFTLAIGMIFFINNNRLNKTHDKTNTLCINGKIVELLLGQTNVT